jgi:hypothetical protein
MKIGLYHFFEPVAYPVLRGKNKQRKGSEAHNRNDDIFRADRSVKKGPDHCIEKIGKKKSNDKL